MQKQLSSQAAPLPPGGAGQLVTQVPFAQYLQLGKNPFGQAQFKAGHTVWTLVASQAIGVGPLLEPLLLDESLPPVLDEPVEVLPDPELLVVDVPPEDVDALPPLEEFDPALLPDPVEPAVDPPLALPELPASSPALDELVPPEPVVDPPEAVVPASPPPSLVPGPLLEQATTPSTRPIAA